MLKTTDADLNCAFTPDDQLFFGFIVNTHLSIWFESLLSSPLNFTLNSQIALKEISSSWETLHKNKSLHMMINLWFTFNLSLLALLPCWLFPMLSFTYSREGTEGRGEYPDLVLCCSKRITPQIWYLTVCFLTPKKTYSSCCCYHQLWQWFARHFYFASCLNVFSFWRDSQIANRDAANCVHVSLVFSLMDYSPGEALACGRLPHDLLLGWHFSFIIAYPIGKISWLIQVSTAPNAKRVGADKTTFNMARRAEVLAAKQMKNLKKKKKKEFLTTDKALQNGCLFYCLEKVGSFVLLQQNRENRPFGWQENKIIHLVDLESREAWG